MQAIHVHTERIALGRKKNTVSNSNLKTNPAPAKPSKTTKVQQKPVKTRSVTKKVKVEEDVVIPDIVLSSDHIASSTENQSTSLASFNSGSSSMLEDSILNDSTGSVKSRPVPKIPGELLVGTPESKLKSPVSFFLIQVRPIKINLSLIVIC